MFQGTYPVFLPKQVLKAEMLSCMEEYPRQMFQILFREYSDGILFGCHVRVEDMELVVEPGIIKWKESLYWMNQEERILYTATGREQYLKVRFLAENNSKDMVKRLTELVLEEDTGKHNELELCRFLLKKGAMLRQNYQDFKDCSTFHNTVNLLYGSYAGKEKNTFAPEITIYYGTELLQCELTNPYDISFGMMCIQEERVQRKLIERYIEKRLGMKGTKEKSLYQLYQYLEEILENAKSGKEQIEKRDRKKQIIVE